MIRSFYKDHFEKLTATSLPINSALPMSKPIVKPTAKSPTKRKWGQPANNANKQAKKNWTFCLFSHLASLFPIRLFVCSVFSWKTSIFFLKSSYQIRRFFNDNKPIKQFFSSFDFSSSSFFTGLKIFLNWSIHWFSSLFSHQVSKFLPGNKQLQIASSINLYVWQSSRQKRRKM